MAIVNGTVTTVKNQELSTNIDSNKSFDYLGQLLSNRTREHTFMTFDDMRVSLGKNNGWGTKVFFASMQAMKLICKNQGGAVVTFREEGKMVDTERTTKSSYIPCKYGAERFPELFVYDEVGDIWGFDGTKLSLFTDEILAELTEKRDEIQAMYDEEDRMRKAISRATFKAKQLAKENRAKLGLED